MNDSERQQHKPQEPLGKQRASQTSLNDESIHRKETVRWFSKEETQTEDHPKSELVYQVVKREARAKDMQLSKRNMFQFV
jgi:hypothetical protein